MTIDFDAFYRVDGYDGIAWTLRGHVIHTQEEEVVTIDENGEEIHDYVFGEEQDIDWVRAVMVGDDREFEFEVSDLTKIDEDDFCHGCGQIGCGH